MGFKIINIIFRNIKNKYINFGNTLFFQNVYKIKKKNY